MAEEERSERRDSDKGIHKIIPSKGDSPAKRRQKVMVLGTIILVVLTLFIVLGRSSGSSSASDSTDDSGGGVANDGSDFTPSGASSGGDGDYNAQLAGEIGSIPAQVSSALNQQTLNKLVHARTRVTHLRAKNKREKTALAHQRAETKKARHKNTVLRRELHQATHRRSHPVHHKGKKAG